MRNWVVSALRPTLQQHLISDVLGRVPTRKKPRQPSVAHWCRVALDFHGVASRFPRPSLQAQVLGCFPHDGPAGSTDEPCAMKPPALELLPGTRLASTYFPPRYGPLQDGPHGPLHPGQIFLAYSRFSHLLRRNKTWDTSGLSARRLRDAVLIERIGAIHRDNYGVYGVRTMWHALDRDGIDIGREQTARLMRLAGVSGTGTGGSPITTRTPQQAGSAPGFGRA